MACSNPTSPHLHAPSTRPASPVKHTILPPHIHAWIGQGAGDGLWPGCGCRGSFFGRPNRGSFASPRAEGTLLNTTLNGAHPPFSPPRISLRSAGGASVLTSVHAGPSDPSVPSCVPGPIQALLQSRGLGVGETLASACLPSPPAPLHPASIANKSVVVKRQERPKLFGTALLRARVRFLAFFFAVLGREKSFDGSGLPLPSALTLHGPILRRRGGQNVRLSFSSASPRASEHGREPVERGPQRALLRQLQPDRLHPTR